MDACQWLDMQSVCSMLGFWQRWLVTSLQHSPRNQWLAVLQRFYTTGDPLAVAVAIALALGVLCLVASLPTNNHSWVDKLWSIVPVLYVWHFALHDRLGHPWSPLNTRLLVMAGLVTVWGTRLTWNFARKGGYAFSAEDYRWPYIRARLHPLAFFLLNATFISFIQHLLLMALAAPAYVAWQNAGTPLNELDALAATLVAFFIAYEAVADQQQWTFQTAKHAKLAACKRLTPEEAGGFCTSGLFLYSRHPNFWAEQSLWWSMYLFSVAASGAWLNWTIAAPLSLTALFQGSTWLTEHITASKYPSYKAYQRTTSCFFPWFPLPPSTGASARTATGGKPTRTPRTPRSGRKVAAAVASPPAVTEDEAEPESEPEAAPAPAATKRVRGRGRAAAPKAAPVEAVAEPAEAPKARPARSPRKTARALAATEAPAPTRQSSRLRTRATVA